MTTGRAEPEITSSAAPGSPQLARRLLLAIESVLGGRGLAGRAWRVWEAVLSVVGRRHHQRMTDAGHALPPVALRVRVIANADAELFVRSGSEQVKELAAACAAYGVAIEDAGRVLDFGCGCGRLLRHWHGYPSLEVHGTDHDAELIAWVTGGLPFVFAQRNGLAPPLPYPDDHFGVVYAVSVFTHMTSVLAEAWMAELTRVIRPGGLLLVTALDRRQFDRLRPYERAAYDRGEPVVQFEDALGTNMCVSYHPRAYVETITPDFVLLGTRPIGAQELYVLRRKHPSRQAV